jgi:hypothetical protein
MSENCIYPIFDLSGILTINQSQKIIYQNAWNTYNRIQSFNSNVSTIHSSGNYRLQYYTFISYAERESFRQGQYLHYQRYPNSNWSSVEEN